MEFWYITAGIVIKEYKKGILRMRKGYKLIGRCMRDSLKMDLKMEMVL